eukprot:2776231-Prymnesium_polylepis.1
MLRAARRVVASALLAFVAFDSSAYLTESEGGDPEHAHHHHTPSNAAAAAPAADAARGVVGSGARARARGAHAPAAAANANENAAQPPSMLTKGEESVGKAARVVAVRRLVDPNSPP